MAEKTSVAPPDPGKKTSPIVSSTESESTIVMDTSASMCLWNDQEFDEGAMVECDGKTYECTFGRWAQVS